MVTFSIFKTVVPSLLLVHNVNGGGRGTPALKDRLRRLLQTESPPKGKIHNEVDGFDKKGDPTYKPSGWGYYKIQLDSALSKLEEAGEHEKHDRIQDLRQTLADARAYEKYQEKYQAENDNLEKTEKETKRKERYKHRVKNFLEIHVKGDGTLDWSLVDRSLVRALEESKRKLALIQARGAWGGYGIPFMGVLCTKIGAVWALSQLSEASNGDNFKENPLDVHDVGHFIGFTTFLALGPFLLALYMFNKASFSWKSTALACLVAGGAGALFSVGIHHMRPEEILQDGIFDHPTISTNALWASGGLILLLIIMWVGGNGYNVNRPARMMQKLAIASLHVVGFSTLIAGSGYFAYTYTEAVKNAESMGVHGGISFAVLFIGIYWMLLAVVEMRGERQWGKPGSTTNLLWTGFVAAATAGTIAGGFELLTQALAGDSNYWPPVVCIFVLAPPAILFWWAQLACAVKKERDHQPGPQLGGHLI